MKRLTGLSFVALTALGALAGCAQPSISLAEFHARQGRLPMTGTMRRNVLPCAADTSTIADPRFGQAMPYYRGQTC